jgi:outer membrane scaffolding protein for murein synthesis (MipA/OmpV family)
MKNPTQLKTLSLGLGAFVLCVAAQAQVTDEDTTNAQMPSREGGTVGLQLRASPDTFGGNGRRASLMPSINYQWANGWFAGTSRGLGYNFSKSPNVQYGLGLGLDMGRASTDNGNLEGMGSIDPKLELTSFVNYGITRDWRVSSVLRYGSGESNQGATIGLGTDYQFRIAPQWGLGLGLSTTWANAQYMQTYYGVTDAQSASSGNSVYTPASGLSDVRANLRVNYEWSPRITVSAGITNATLLGDAKDSPLVTQTNSVSQNISLNYKF